MHFLTPHTYTLPTCMQWQIQKFFLRVFKILCVNKFYWLKTIEFPHFQVSFIWNTNKKSYLCHLFFTIILEIFWKNNSKYVKKKRNISHVYYSICRKIEKKYEKKKLLMSFVLRIKILEIFWENNGERC